MNASANSENNVSDGHGALEGESFHQWYQIIIGFDWKLVQHIIDCFKIGPNHLVLDPFCGAGTTLVQCKKQGIPSVGIDANPVCTLASQVKTFWHLNPDQLKALLDEVLDEMVTIECDDLVASDLALAYLQESGMIERGWLSLHKAKKILALNAAIKHTEMKPAERKFFRLALVSAVVDRIADIKFGPEVYCLKSPKRTHVIHSFVDAIDMMIADLAGARQSESSRVKSDVHLGDSREAGVLKKAVGGGADFIGEHELAFKQAGCLWDHRQSPPQPRPKGKHLSRTTL